MYASRIGEPTRIVVRTRQHGTAKCGTIYIVARNTVLKIKVLVKKGGKAPKAAMFGRVGGRRAAVG